MICVNLCRLFNPIPNDKLDTSNVKEYVDDNSKFDENGGEFSKWVENTVGKGEIAHNEQFLLFPQCFLTTCTTDMKKNKGFFGKSLKGSPGHQISPPHRFL